MSPSVRALGLLNRLFDKFVMLLALLLVFFAAFNIWDNNQLYMAVDTVQAALMSLKPSTTQGTETGGIIDYSNENDLFGQLKAINPDIRAWLIVDGTSIDFPVLQGEDNFHYLNRDPYGNFAVAGSVFMDYRCDKDMEGNYLLMYAHHMGQGKMFGDLDQFEKAEFFKENTTGTLITPSGTYNLEILGHMIVSASDSVIYDPELYQEVPHEVVRHVKECADNLNEEALSHYEAAPEDYKILCMTTCSSRFTDARTVVTAILRKA